VLSPAERDRLLSLPREQFFRELWRRYVRWKVPEGPQDREPMKPPPGHSAPAPPARRPTRRRPKARNPPANRWRTPKSVCKPRLAL